MFNDHSLCFLVLSDLFFNSASIQSKNQQVMTVKPELCLVRLNHMLNVFVCVKRLKMSSFFNQVRSGQTSYQLTAAEKNYLPDWQWWLQYELITYLLAQTSCVDANNSQMTDSMRVTTGAQWRWRHVQQANTPSSPLARASLTSLIKLTGGCSDQVLSSFPGNRQGTPEVCHVSDLLQEVQDCSRKSRTVPGTGIRK